MAESIASENTVASKQVAAESILVAGAGIGGLTAAIALRQAGYDVEVFERSPKLREVGAGVTLWSNAMSALERIGVAADVQPAGSKIHRAELWSWDGVLMSSTPVAEIGHELGMWSYGIHRADLQRLLHRRCLQDGVTLHLDEPCVGFASAADSVTLELTDGRQARGACLIGADGIGSAIRRQLLNDGRPRYRGSTAWRGIIDEGEGTEPGLAWVLWGRGRRFGTFPVGEGKQCWFAVTPAPPAEWDEPRLRDWLSAYFDSAALATRPIIERTPQGELLRTDLLSRPPVDVWGEGRVTLLGDAAHAMAPTLAQGAAQAIEDGVILADRLSQASDIESGLRRYEQRRQPRSRWLVEQSERINTVTAWENPLVCRLRDLVVRGLSPWTVRQMRAAMSFPG